MVRPVYHSTRQNMRPTGRRTPMAARPMEERLRPSLMRMLGRERREQVDRIGLENGELR